MEMADRHATNIAHICMCMCVCFYILNSYEKRQSFFISISISYPIAQ